jgi:hypothetical protein
MDNDDMFDEFYKLADTVIYMEEVNAEEKAAELCFKKVMENVNSFFEQVDKKLSLCENDEDRDFAKEITLNFLIFSLKKLIADYDAPDENIEYLANHLRDQILQVKRKK